MAIFSFENLGQHPVNLGWKPTAILFLVLPCALTYLFTYLRCHFQLQSKVTGREPPTVPYAVPFLGHALSFTRDFAPFLRGLTSKYGYSQPVAIAAGPFKMFVPSAPQHFEILLRSSKELSSKTNQVIALKNLFGVPKGALKYYEADDSGSQPKPLPGSSIKPENRIFFHQHQSTHKYLNGHALNLMTERLVESFSKQLRQAQDITEEWTDMPDFWLWFRGNMFQASVEALFGKHMLRLNPSLVDDFWEYDRQGLSILKGLPRWMNPSGYAIRDKVMNSIKKWHKFASDHVDATKVAANDPEWDEYWGAKVFKARQEYMAAMHFLDDDAKAGEDLGFMFASNANAIPAAGWMALHTFLDPALLERARKDVEDSLQPSSDAGAPETLNIPKLCSKPLLQSMYAEALRLNTGIVVGRTPFNGPLRVGEWLFPKGQMILLSSRTAAMNAEIWNTGTTDEPHPLDTFWADRFVVYPDRPQSGPLKNPAPQAEKLEAPEYSMRGLSGAWFPYGGGLGMCPGRHFAKQEVIAGMAVLVASFDIELKVPNGFVPQADMNYFPMGILPIKDKIPFRIRKRV